MMGGVIWYALGLLAGLALPFLFRKPRARISVTEDGHWQFPIDTLSQMLAIPVARRERFLAELPAMFRKIWALADSMPLGTLPGALWVDDELGEFRLTVVNLPENAGDAFATSKLTAT